MQKKTVLKFILLPFGIALLIAGLFFDRGIADTTLLQAQATPDRLAEPTLPAAPSQADHGAQVYWLSCMPCHGDQGQGLTDEFRATYPPEEQYCWESGCHGANPYESGFTLPKQIPAVMGESSLAKFADAVQLNAYIRATMPYWSPGSLAEEDAWRVTAFILRENALWESQAELSATNAASVRIPRPALTSVVTPQPVETREGVGASAWIFWIGLPVLLIALLFILKKSRNTTTI